MVAIADMLTENPDMKATAAMRRIKRDASDAEIHRWQDKWKQRKTGLLAEAAVRAHEVKRKRAEKEAIEATRVSGIDILKFASRLPGLPALDPLWEVFNSPEMRFARELHSNGTMRSISELQKSPEMEAARRIANETREALRLFNDPSTRDALKAIEEQRTALKSVLGGGRSI